mmetsp:Transcript_16089/g.18216  ORF Transcript_16089/g.18216 Transcript_16089/m.18216 type:complete len:266 (+) Transcript_16089:237-1034(+)
MLRQISRSVSARILPSHIRKGAVSFEYLPFQTRFFSEDEKPEGSEEIDAEAVARAEAKRVKEEERQKEKERLELIKSEQARLRQERIDYRKQVSALRKQYAEEYRTKEEKKAEELKKKQAKSMKTKPKHPKVILPVVEAFPDLSKEEYAAYLLNIQESKGKEREKVYERLEKVKAKREVYKEELVKALQQESSEWFTEEDIINQSQLQQKVADQLEDLYPLRTSFERVLPSNPYKLAHLFEDEASLPVSSKYEERDISEVYDNQK